MEDFVIGVDIGGTNIKAGAVDYQQNIIARRRAPTEADAGGEAILQKLVQLVLDLKADCADRSLRAVGFGIPGAIRAKDGVVTQAPNVPAWTGVPVGKLLQERLQLPCYVENDANAFAMGEMWAGAGKGCRHLVGLTFGTGVGGGIIIDGMLVRGADGMAGELGHIAVQADGAPCKCGSRGCIESYASATGIVRMFHEALDQGKTTRVPKTDDITPALIYEYAIKGDVLSREILEFAGKQLGVGLASLVNIFNPEMIVLGGGVSAAWDIFAPPAIETMKQRAFKAPAARVSVVRAELQDDAGVYGSAYNAMNQLVRPENSDGLERRITPWGFWEVLESAADYKVKRIYVHSGHRLSYQKHAKREETWMIAAGEAAVTLDGKDLRLKAGETIHIEKTQAHRIGNPGPDPLVFLEVQRGTYFGEDDIVRLQDDYRRA